jgi:gliding motility-associated protein GldE
LEAGWFYYIVAIFFLLLLGAFFSGSEIALFSLDKKKIKEIKANRPLVGGYIDSLLEYPRRFLVTILFGNNVVNIAVAIISVNLALQFASAWNVSKEVILLIQIIVITLLILFFGEIIPKLFANKYPVKFSLAAAVPLYWFNVLVYPISKLLSDLLKFTVSRLGNYNSRTAIGQSEIAELADLGIEKGTIEEEEHELIHGLVQYKSVVVREIMTPRVDISAVGVDTTFDELIATITESGHSRIPLYSNSLDEIIGIIYAKDVLQFLAKPELKKDFTLLKIARQPLFVPETKLISDLMGEFQNKNMHIGIVVDEYGGTSGLVSFEDILEEIVGDIRDELDKEETPVLVIDDKRFMALGKTSIDDLNELLGFDFSSANDDYDTIGGFIFNYTGTIPAENFSFTIDKFKFTVKEVRNKRINKVLIEKI